MSNLLDQSLVREVNHSKLTTQRIKNHLHRNLRVMNRCIPGINSMATMMTTSLTISVEIHMTVPAMVGTHVLRKLLTMCLRLVSQLFLGNRLQPSLMSMNLSPTGLGPTPKTRQAFLGKVPLILCLVERLGLSIYNN